MRDLDQKSKKDLDLLNSQLFIYSLRILYRPILIPKSSILSIESYILAVSYIKAPDSKSDIATKKVKANQRSSFEQSW